MEKTNTEGGEPWHGTVNGYTRKKCRCDSCKEAYRGYHRNYKALKAEESKEAGTSIYKARGATPSTGEESWHGTTNGYCYHKCRCDRCKTANTDYLRGLRQAKAARLREEDATAGVGPNPVRGIGDEPWHGTRNGYANYHCRCEPCREAQRQYSSAYGKENRESYRARAAAWREANRDRFNENARRYTQENREKIREQVRQRLAANPELREKKLEATRAWRAANPERVAELRRAAYYANQKARIESARRWQEANPEKTKANCVVQRSIYRARKKNAPSLPFTAAQLLSRMAYWGNQCYICGGPFEAVDHVKPLSRGGSHALMNTRPICNFHNSSKHARWHGIFWIKSLTWSLAPGEPIPLAGEVAA